MASDGNADFSEARDRIGAFQGQPAPAPDLSWAVPGEAPHLGPKPLAGPGELAPCDSSMYDGDE